MNIRIANRTEFNEIRLFYHKVIDLMQNTEYHPAWKKGVYPSDAYLMESLDNSELLVGEYNNEYVAAMIINHKCNDEYKNVKWTVEAEVCEVTIVHALCVLPTFQGKGIAGALVRNVIEIAESTNQKAVRLDVLAGNLPAEKLYIKYGFQYVTTIQMFYEDTGRTDFKLFEYIISSEGKNNDS